VKKWDEHIKMQEEDLMDYERDLAAIYEPFTNLQRALRSESQPYGARMHAQYDINAGGYG
jgi:hypothetical protein